VKELLPLDPKTRQMCRVYQFDNSYVIVAKKSDLAEFLAGNIGEDECAICVPKEVLSPDLESVECSSTKKSPTPESKAPVGESS